MDNSNSQNYENLSKLASSSPIYNHAIGSIIGAFLGDAMGAPLEFDEKLTPLKIKTSMKLSGGGHFEVASGQVTDDSELALSQAHSLITEPYVLNLGQIAYSYMIWYNSVPFDVGRTTKNALKGLKFKEDGVNNLERLYLQAKNNSLQYNVDSLSNGSLMRITPLAVWCHRMDDFEDIELAVRLENELTHPNEIIHKADSVYVLAIKELINNQGDYDQAIKKIESLMKKKSEIHKKSPWNAILEWFFDAHMPTNQQIPAIPHEGFAGIAWTYAMSAFLKKEPDFLNGMETILMKGGDTDTNACIYGGLIGAALGFNKLPKDLVEKILDCKQIKQKRPKHLHPNEIIKILPKLIKYAPETLFYRGVALEFRLSDISEVYDRFMKIAIDSRKNNKALGCLFGFLMGEEREKTQPKNSKKLKEEKKDEDSFDLIMKFLYKLTSANAIKVYDDAYQKEKFTNPLHCISSMIPLAIYTIFTIEDRKEFIKKTMEKATKGNKEASFIYCHILLSLLSKIKATQIISSIENLLDDKVVENDDFKTIRVWFFNSEIFKTDLKKNDLKTTMVLIFDCLKTEGGLDFMENEDLLKKAVFKENLGIIGALCGAYKEFSNFERKKVEEILRKPRPPRFHLNNLLFLIAKLINFK